LMAILEISKSCHAEKEVIKTRPNHCYKLAICL